MKRYALGIDIGGTFTDAVLFDREKGRRLAAKTLTTPGDPVVAVVNAVDQIISRENLSGREIDRVVHATTLFTNALIEHKGAKTALLTTEGFRDSLEIGRERKYDLYDLAAKKPRQLAPRTEDLRFPSEFLPMAPFIAPWMNNPSNKSLWLCVIKTLNPLVSSFFIAIEMGTTNGLQAKGLLNAFQKFPLAFPAMSLRKFENMNEPRQPLLTLT